MNAETKLFIRESFVDDNNPAHNCKKHMIQANFEQIMLENGFVLEGKKRYAHSTGHKFWIYRYKRKWVK